MRKAYAKLLSASGIPAVPAGRRCRAIRRSPPSRVLELPVVRGAIEVWSALTRCSITISCVTFPPEYKRAGCRRVAAHAPGFDDRSAPRIRRSDHVLPHDVTREMGGTRFVPGTHLRVVSEAAVARYQGIRGQQHVVSRRHACSCITASGTAAASIADRLRYMFKSASTRRCRNNACRIRPICRTITTNSDRSS
jgi:hypothetical protein